MQHPIYEFTHEAYPELPLPPSNPVGEYIVRLAVLPNPVSSNWLTR